MDSDSSRARWLSFDPTIHAGHLITALTMIVCAVSTYYGMQGQIELLKLENVQREKDIASVKSEASSTTSAMNLKIDTIVSVQRQEVGQLRDDIKSWFMNLDQKLDRKADKR
jgi:ATP-dependent Zn protease